MPSRRGFTLVEMVLVMAVLLTLAAILVPQVAGRVRDAEAAALLAGLTTAADAASAFKADVRRYPAQLAFLTDTTTATPTDLCGDTIPPVLRRRWGGPYLRGTLTTDGVRAGTATIANAVGRFPAGGEISNLVLIGLTVEERTAAALEARIDDGDFATGSVLWIDGGAGSGTLLYLVPVRGC